MRILDENILLVKDDEQLEVEKKKEKLAKIKLEISKQNVINEDNELASSEKKSEIVDFPLTTSEVQDNFTVADKHENVKFVKSDSSGKMKKDIHESHSSVANVQPKFRKDKDESVKHTSLNVKSENNEIVKDVKKKKSGVDAKEQRVFNDIDIGKITTLGSLIVEAAGGTYG